MIWARPDGVKGVLDWPPSGPAATEEVRPDELHARRAVGLASRSARSSPAAVVCEGLRRTCARAASPRRPEPWRSGSARGCSSCRDPSESASLLLRVLAGLSARRSRDGAAGRVSPRRQLGGRLGAPRRLRRPPEAGIYPWMTPREVLDLAARPGGVRPRRAPGAGSTAVVEAYRTAADLDRPISRGGESLAQRTALAAAMLTDPEVLLLDEPLRAVRSGGADRGCCDPGARRTVLLASRYPASEAGVVNAGCAAARRPGGAPAADRRARRARPAALAARASRPSPTSPRPPGPPPPRDEPLRTLVGMALRELWISFRLSPLLGASCWSGRAGAGAVLAPSSAGETASARLASGTRSRSRAAIAVAAGLAAATLRTNGAGAGRSPGWRCGPSHGPSVLLSPGSSASPLLLVVGMALSARSAACRWRADRVARGRSMRPFAPPSWRWQPPPWRPRRSAC